MDIIYGQIFYRWPLSSNHSKILRKELVEMFVMSFSTFFTVRIRHMLVTESISDACRHYERKMKTK